MLSLLIRQGCFSLLAGTALLAACSHQGIYEGTHMQRLEACRDLRPADREVCEARARRPYGEYAKERKQALDTED